MVGVVRAEDAPVVPLGEAEKIEKLIVSVESLEGAVFIRNGAEYTAKDAGSHLRRKLKSAGSRITTAAVFIDRIGTKSSMSGEEYKIRFADGKTATLRDHLLKELEKIEAPKK
ncbi:MAG: DUF5329 family protein [Kiritimatiellia bacterium]